MNFEKMLEISSIKHKHLEQNIFLRKNYSDLMKNCFRTRNLIKKLKSYLKKNGRKSENKLEKIEKKKRKKNIII